MTAITHLTSATEEQRAAITAPLGAHSRDQGFVWNPTHVTLALRDGETIFGGLIGFTQWDWLYVEILVVDASLRGQGWGRKLIEAAENIVRDNGCCGLWLSTFTFQAPTFYERLGFTRCGEIPNYPAGQSRLFYMKHVETTDDT